MKKAIILLIVLFILIPGTLKAVPFPVSFSAKGGIGTGYFSMSKINSQITELRQVYDTNLESIDSGFQVYLDGRVWLFDRIAVIAGFEHYWVEAAMDAAEFTLTYKAPASVYLLGGAVNILKFPNLLDINVGGRGTYTKAIYGSNEFTESSRLLEYKKNSYGWDIFVEATTTFINPVEIGMMLGYRRVSLTDLENKYEEIAVHAVSGDKVALDYSGMFFYITAGVRLW